MGCSSLVKASRVIQFDKTGVFSTMTPLFQAFCASSEPFTTRDDIRYKRQQLQGVHLIWILATGWDSNVRLLTDAFRNNETGKLFEGDQQQQNNGVAEMLFSEACLPSGRGSKGEETIWLQSCVLVLGFNSSRECVWVHVYVCGKRGWSYSAHILMRCQGGSCPLLPHPLTVMASAERKRGGSKERVRKRREGCVKIEAG